MKTTKTISDLNAKFQQRVRKLTEEYDYQKLQAQTYADYMVALLIAYEQQRERINEVEPKYYAMVKDHENFTNDFKYWNYNQEHLILGSKYPKASHTNMMTKSQWNELGINDSNADFVKVKNN